MLTPWLHPALWPCGLQPARKEVGTHSWCDDKTAGNQTFHWKHEKILSMVPVLIWGRSSCWCGQNDMEDSSSPFPLQHREDGDIRKGHAARALALTPDIWTFNWYWRLADCRLTRSPGETAQGFMRGPGKQAASPQDLGGPCCLHLTMAIEAPRGLLTGPCKKQQRPLCNPQGDREGVATESALRVVTCLTVETNLPASDLTALSGLLIFLQPQAWDSSGLWWEWEWLSWIYAHWGPQSL